jgi:hypothetical protein
MKYKQTIAGLIREVSAQSQPVLKDIDDCPAQLAAILPMFVVLIVLFVAAQAVAILLLTTTRLGLAIYGKALAMIPASTVPDYSLIFGGM